MDTELRILEIEAQHTAAEFLALNWGTSRSKVRAAVEELIAGTQLSSSSMGYLLRQSSKLPVQDEPARKLHDLVTVVTALHEKKKIDEYALPLPLELHEAEPLRAQA